MPSPRRCWRRSPWTVRHWQPSSRLTARTLWSRRPRPRTLQHQNGMDTSPTPQAPSGCNPSDRTSAQTTADAHRTRMSRRRPWDDVVRPGARTTCPLRQLCARSVQVLPDAVDDLIVDPYRPLRPWECRVAVQPVHLAHGPRERVVPLPLGQGEIPRRLGAVAQEGRPPETRILAPHRTQHPPLLFPLRLMSRRDIYGDHDPDHVMALLLHSAHSQYRGRRLSWPFTSSARRRGHDCPA